MHYIKAISPSLIIHYLELNPDSKEDSEILDKLIDKKWVIKKSDEKRTYTPIKSLYGKLI